MVRNPKKVLFIEGTRNDKNGNLGQGYSILLRQRLSMKMPHIVMSNGIAKAIDKFKNSNQTNDNLLLIDLDGKGELIRQGDYRQTKIDKKRRHEINSHEFVFFMVQKIEAWFLSQPEILKDVFKKDFTKIPFDHPSKIEHPDEVLMELTRELKSNSYHKVKHGSRLLAKLNLAKLATDFDDVKELVDVLGGEV